MRGKIMTLKKRDPVEEFIERWHSLTPYDLLRNMEIEMEKMRHGYGHYIWHPVWQSLETIGSDFPRTELVEEADRFIVLIEASDVKKSDIEIHVSERSVEVKGSTSRFSVSAAGQKMEKRDFYRRIPLPSDVAEEGAEAHLKHGILMVSMPKKMPTRKRRLRVK